MSSSSTKPSHAPHLVTKPSDTTTTTTAASQTTTTASTDNTAPTEPSSSSSSCCTHISSPPVSISAVPATGSPSISICSEPSETEFSKDRPPSPSLPTFSPRIVYGPAAIARLPSELGRLHLTSPLIISSPSCIGLARRVQTLIPNLDSRILDSSLINVPQKVVDDAVTRITDRDCVISIGGTSAMGLARTIGGIKEFPHICIPTMYSGSEMGGNFSPEASRRRSKMNSRRRKRSDSSPHRSASSVHSDSGSSRKSADIHSRNMPSIVIYDEELTGTGTPARFSAPTCSRSESKARASSNDDAQWSYIHLPGV